MSDAEPPKPGHDLAPGLLEYYSSQAELMLAQFDNINRLLGPTKDHIHTGEFCEILFRDFLRRFLPPGLSVDKGYFYGRTTLNGKNVHCPEIDLLVHDSERFKPIFRMGDFVIVQPQAVRGMLQVKRTFSNKDVKRGLANIILAKQHLLNVLWRGPEQRATGVGWLGSAIPPPVFTALIGFETELSK